ncbi:MAG: biopolymer transporter ExbD [Rhizobiaceae bacterium]|nr:biopolymer transporter ExbD [Rhizobiaceae bacterium]
MSYIPARPKRARHDFSLTIINIVFLLLLFYLATGSLIKQNELTADIPFSKDMPLERLPRPLLLAAADGTLFLDGQPVSLDALKEIAPQAVGDRAYLNILAERTLPATSLVAILAEVDAGGVAARLVTLRERRDGSAP